MDLKECENKGFIRKTKVDTNLVKSLIEISNIKETSVKDIILNEITINAFLPLAYDSLREVLEAYCILNGFKVGNHICLGKLVKKLNPCFDIELFDRLRYMRNGINYYGNKVDLEQGRKMMNKLFELKKETLKIIKIEDIN
jgi:hypothetical protein